VNKPLLHVVIPAYGQSPYLKETLLRATRKLAANVPITVLEDPSENNNVREVVSDFLGRVDNQINPSRLARISTETKIFLADYLYVIGCIFRQLFGIPR